MHSKNTLKQFENVPQPHYITVSLSFQLFIQSSLPCIQLSYLIINQSIFVY